LGNLRRLNKMHSLIPREECSHFRLAAALGLQRRGHEPGKVLPVALPKGDWECVLNWRKVSQGKAEALDPRRITEDGAEAVALAVISEAMGWKVVRRYPQGRHADWELSDAQNRVIALEISGCARNDPRRLKKKLTQVAKCKYAHLRVACVVEFGPPRARMAEVGG